MNDGTAAAFQMPSMEELSKMPKEEMEKAIRKFFNRENNNPRDILFQMTSKAKQEAGDYPLYYTEWNGSKEFDTSYQAAFVAQTIAYNEGLVEGYSFWTVSDIFEEMGLKGAPFKNEFGIQNNYGIPKPVYRVFQTLHEAGDQRLDVRAATQMLKYWHLQTAGKRQLLSTTMILNAGPSNRKKSD